MKVTKKSPKNRTNAELPVVRDPLRGMLSLREAMERLFDESFWSPFGLLEGRPAGLTDIVPSIDVSETDKEVKIRADVPGVDPDKINIEVTEDSLAISGSVEKSEEEKSENFYRMERQTGKFFREIVLPSKVDPDSVEAKAKHGTITITLKKQSPGQKRKVQIKTE